VQWLDVCHCQCPFALLLLEKGFMPQHCSSCLQHCSLFPRHCSLCHGIALCACSISLCATELLFVWWCCSSAMVLLLGLWHCFFVALHSAVCFFMPQHWQLCWNFFLLWSWQLHCVLFHGIFFRPWHWQLCLMLCCSIFLCAFVKQCAMAFFSMLQHCSIACYTAALALHLMQGAIVVIPHCSQ